MPWRQQIFWWLQRRRREDMLRAELDFHLAEEAAEHREDGTTHEETAWAARRDLGNVTLIKEDARALWTWTLLEQLVQDVRFAVRTMMRNRSATIVATLTLALGIGANMAVYSFMDGILLRALPVPEPSSLVVIKWHSSKPAEFGGPNTGRDSGFVMHSIDGQMYDEAGGSTARIFPYPAYQRLQQAADSVMSGLFAYYPAGRLSVVTRNEADVIQGEYVSGGYFAGLRVAPAAGRVIQTADDRTNAPPVAMVSMRYARMRFGDAQAAVGQPIRINNEPATIVGVTPAEFFGVDPAAAPDVYLPLHSGPISDDPNGYWLEMMGRLRSGIDVSRAQAVLAATFQPWVASTATTVRERANLPQLRLDPGASGLDIAPPLLPAPVPVDGHGCADSRDRLCKHGEPTAGARRGAPARNGGAT